MNTQKYWTESEKQQAIDLRIQGLSMSEIGKRIGRSRSSVSNFIWAWNQNGPHCPTEPAKTTQVNHSSEPAVKKNPTVTAAGEDMVAEACTENVRTLEDLISVCQIDLEKWQVERWVANTWPVGVKVGDTIVTKNLYQIKANLKLKPITKEDIRQLFVDNTPVQTVKHRKAKVVDDGEVLLEICVPDLHLGKLCWGEETGGSNYNTEEAMDRFMTAIEDLLTRINPNQIGRILLPLGNDLLNVDSKNNETANGTPQTEDGRWQRSFKKACELTTWAVNRCSEVAPVDVLIVPGNHDTERSYYLGCFLEAMFAKDANVDINNAPTERKYYSYGNTLLGFTHGDRIKLKDLINLAQTEQRKAWGGSKFCEWHLGHLHRESTLEDGGVIARVIPSLCPPDAWHSKSGYVMAAQAAQAFVFDKETGLDAIMYHRIG